MALQDTAKAQRNRGQNEALLVRAISSISNGTPGSFAAAAPPAQRRVSEVPLTHARSSAGAIDPGHIPVYFML
jgi:hypothetical protein